MGSKYMSSFPNWLQYLIFLKQGFYSGSGWHIVKSRLFCLLDRHKYPLSLLGSSMGVEKKQVQFEKTQELRDGYIVSFSLQCVDCGYSVSFSGEYRGYDEHRIERVSGFIQT